MRSLAVTSFVLLLSCGSDAELGGAKTTCLDADRSETSECAVPLVGGICEAASNPSCAPLKLLEVSNPAADGPCVRIVMNNECDAMVFSRTCIEFRSTFRDELQWQCWTSSTFANNEMDVGECNATGKWRHWSSLSSGELDTVEGSCDPEAE